MARFPLTLSAHPSAWADGGEGGATAASGGTCQLCGQPVADWQEPFHLNDDHNDNRDSNIAVSCPLCHLVQHLGRSAIDREAILIWLPEMAQPALSLLVREIHLACAANGLNPAYAELIGGKGQTSVTAPGAAYRALYDRSDAAELRLGTRSPSQLGVALLELPPEAYAERRKLLAGIRLLPLGRLFRQGRDIYPQILRDWSALRQGQADLSS